MPELVRALAVRRLVRSLRTWSLVTAAAAGTLTLSAWAGGKGAGTVCGGGVLCSAEVADVVAATARSLDAPTMTVAVVDRLGNVLALHRGPAADPAQDDAAIGVARTAALFSNDQAPLSSRTVRFVSGIHFPPGVARTANAALYGIENTNRGCQLDPSLERGQDVAEGRSLAGVRNGERCDGLDRLGCGRGVVTGKANLQDDQPRAVNPGGVPLFRALGAPCSAAVLGGVGVAGMAANQAEYAAFTGAFTAATQPVPCFPLPDPQNVFIDGVRLPFVEQVGRPAGTRAGSGNGSYEVGPLGGKAARDGYLLGPRAGSRLSADEVDRTVRQAIATANRTRAQIRLPLGSRTRMVIAVADVDGTLLALHRMSDATVFSIDVAASKARNVVYFSGAGAVDLPGLPAGTAVTNRTIGFGAQPLFPPGIDGSGGGPFFDLFLRDAATPCTQGRQAASANPSGIVFFPGSTPLYKGREVVGGLGVSGDGVEQDDYVTFGGAQGLLPPEDIWANRVSIRGVRLPFFKFPRNPEG
jgi:uncharacterized protein GlcG (DUF336 family)